MSDPSTNGATGHDMTVAELIAAYLRDAEKAGVYVAKALAQRRYRLGLFAAAYGTLKVKDCKTFMLIDWIEAHPEWKSSSTKRASAGQVNAVWNWALRQERIDRNPFSKVDFPEAEPRMPMADIDLDMLAEMCNKPFEHALRFLRLTGCRAGELCGMTWADVDLDTALVTIQMHKTRKRTKKPRYLPLTPDAVELLRKLRARHPGDGTVFLNNRGTPWTKDTLGQHLRNLKQKHGIDTKATLHGLRHQFGSSAVKNGAPLKLVSLALGHSSQRTTERYYVNLDEDFDAIRRAAQMAVPQPKPEK